MLYSQSLSFVVSFIIKSFVVVSLIYKKILTITPAIGIYLCKCGDRRTSINKYKVKYILFFSFLPIYRKKKKKTNRFSVSKRHFIKTLNLEIHRCSPCSHLSFPRSSFHPGP